MTEVLSGSERVRRSRWVNKVEEVADQLLELLRAGPEPLPRTPVVEAELVDRLGRFTLAADDTAEADFPNVRFLQLGNGHQAKNRAAAMACMQRMFGAEKLDTSSIKWGKWGTCRFSAYTHPHGAMISTPHRDDNEFGSAPWHSRDHLVMFRDAGDGRCVVYVNDIEPLFGMRTIGHHGVRWEDIHRSAKHVQVFASADALRSIGVDDQAA